MDDRGLICWPVKSSFRLLKIILSTGNGILSIGDSGKTCKNSTLAKITNAINFQFEFEPRNPTLGAQNVKQVLAESFGIDVTDLGFKAEVARATGKWPEDHSN